MIEWENLTDLSDLDKADSYSYDRDVLLFKHSTTCSISSMAKMRLEASWDFSNEALIPFYLDLKKYRDVSNAIAERYQVHHESPQVLLIRKGECIYDASHFDISVDEIKEALDYYATPS